MIDIQVGEYARTTQGYIAKVERIDDTFIWFDGVIWFDYEECWELRIKSELGLEDQLNEIIKHSFNILDLIEVGDYVNGQKVIKKTILGDGSLVIEVGLPFATTYIQAKDINTIVTKELMKSIEYRVN